MAFQNPLLSKHFPLKNEIQDRYQKHLEEAREMQAPNKLIKFHLALLLEAFHHCAHRQKRSQPVPSHAQRSFTRGFMIETKRSTTANINSPAR